VAIFTEKLACRDTPVPIAGVQTLLEVMSRSRAVTIMGIQSDLKGACVPTADDGIRQSVNLCVAYVSWEASEGSAVRVPRSFLQH
jgi:hypothetical protein